MVPTWGFMDIPLPCVCHELHAFICDAAPPATYTSHIVPIAKPRACAILGEFNKAQTELIGKAVILTDGKAGTVNELMNSMDCASLSEATTASGRSQQ